MKLIKTKKGMEISTLIGAIIFSLMVIVIIIIIAKSGTKADGAASGIFSWMGF